MTLIAEAFVAVRPDLSGFAADLKKQLGAIPTPKIAVQPYVSKAGIAQFKKEMAAITSPTKPYTVAVQPIVTARAAATFRQELAKAVSEKPIPIKGSVTELTASGKKSAAASTKQTTQAAETASTKNQTKAVAEQAKAVEKAANEAAAWDKLQKRVSVASSDAAKRVTDETLALARLESATLAASDAQKAFLAAERSGDRDRIARTRALRDEARAAQELAQTRLAVVQSRAAGPVADPKGQASAIASAEANVARARELGNASLVRQAEAVSNAQKKVQDKIASDQRAEGAARAASQEQERLAELEKKREPLLTRLGRAQEVAKDSSITMANSLRDEATISAKAQLVDATRADAKGLLTAANKKLLGSEVAQAEAAVASLSAQEAQLALEAKAVNLKKTLGQTELSNARTGGLVAKANAEAAAAEKLVETATLGAAAARKTGNLALESEFTALRNVSQARLADLELSAQQAPLLAKEIGLRQSLASALVVESTTSQRAGLLRGLELSVGKLYQASVASTALTKAQKESIAALFQETAALAANTAEQAKNEQKRIQNANAARAQSGQAVRGGLATGATFLGLRGAVLASSLPFLAATVGVTAISKTVQSAAQLEETLNVLQATTGATTDEMQAVSEASKRLGADLTLPATSANDAAEAMTELAKAGISVEDSLAAARGVLQLSAAANISATDAAKIAATQLNAFRLSGDQAERVTNLLAGAAKSAQGEITDFAAAFQQASAQANQSGLSIEQTTTLLTQLARAGIRGSDAGTSLRVMLLRLVPNSNTAAEAMARLGIQIDKTRTIGAQLPELIVQFTQAISKLGPQGQTKAIRDIFGQDASRAAIETLTRGLGAYRAVNKEVTKAGNASSLTEARAKGLKGANDALASTTQNLATTIGEDLAPALEATVRALTDIVALVDTTVSAFDPLADAIGRVVGVIPGGSKAIAQIGLVAAAAVGLNKIVQHRARVAAETAAAAKIAAAQEVAAQGTVTTSVMATVRANQVLIDTYGLRGAAAVRLAQQEVAAGGASLGLLGRLRKGVAGKGLIGGIAATLIGEEAGGTAGGILSGAGQGAVLGSIFPGVGTIVGAAGGAVVSAMNEAQKRREEDKAKSQDKWSSLTFMEQIEFSKSAAGRWIIETNNLKFKSNPFKGKFNFPKINLRSTDKGVSQNIKSLFTPIVTKKELDAATGGAAGQLGPVLKQALAIARARAEDDNKALLAALRVREKYVAERIAVLEDHLKSTDFTNKQKAAIAQQLIEVIGESKDIEDEIAEILASDSTFNAKLSAAELAAVQAQGTKTLTDDLASARAIAAAELALLNELLSAKKKDKEAIAAQRIAVAQANNEVTSVQNQITQDALDAATEAAEKAQEIEDERVSVQEAKLKRAADAAGNVGKAEQNYLAFLRKRINAAKDQSIAEQNAIDAYNAEVARRNAAIVAGQQARIGFREARLDARSAMADLTKTNKDDIRVERLRLKLIDAQLKAAYAVKRKAKEGTAAWWDARAEIQRLVSQKAKVREEIQNLIKGDKDKDEDRKGLTFFDVFKMQQDLLSGFSSSIAFAGVPGVPMPNALASAEDINARIQDITHGEGISNGDKAIVGAIEKQTNVIRGTKTQPVVVVPGGGRANPFTWTSGNPMHRRAQAYADAAADTGTGGGGGI